jgi:hypothetical protein
MRLFKVNMPGTCCEDGAHTPRLHDLKIHSGDASLAACCNYVCDNFPMFSMREHMAVTGNLQHDFVQNHAATGLKNYSTGLKK